LNYWSIFQHPGRVGEKVIRREKGRKMLVNLQVCAGSVGFIKQRDDQDKEKKIFFMQKYLFFHIFRI
jgi:hypothetical protein